LTIKRKVINLGAQEGNAYQRDPLHKITGIRKSSLLKGLGDLLVISEAK